MLWDTGLASPYRRPVREALARHVDLEVRLLEIDRRPERDASANRGRDWAVGDGAGYSLGEIRAVRLARHEARHYTLIGFPRRRPDSILLGGWESPADWQFLLLAKLTGVRTVGFYESTLQTSTLQTQLHVGGPIGWMRRRFFNALDAVVVPGPAARQAILSLGVDPGRIELGFNAVDGRIIHGAARRKRAANGVPRADGHHFVYVGELIERKGVDLLIGAFAAMREDGDTLTVFGTGALEDDLRRTAVRRGVADAVTFASYVLNEDIPAALADKHTLVFPSRQEVWGLVVNEALAAGLHVVVSDVAGATPFVTGMRGVFTAPPFMSTIASGMRASRDAWDGPVEAPEILDYGPEELADVFLRALAPEAGSMDIMDIMDTMDEAAAPPHTVIVEDNVTGHRLYYVRILADAAVREDRRVSVVLPAAHREREEIALHLSELDERIELRYVSDPEIADTARLSYELRADLTVVPDADRMAATVGLRHAWRGRGTLSLLIMRDVGQPSRLPGVQTAKTLLRSALFVSASSVGNVRVSVLKPSGWAGRSILPTASDPVTLTAGTDDVLATAAAWGVEPGRYWFAVLGAIAPRKNVGLIARALTGITERPIGLLIAGLIEPQARLEIDREIERLSASGVRVVMVDRLLTGLELDSAVTFADCVVLAHSNEGPSGLFGKAAAAGTRIVAAGAASLRHDAAEAGDGADWVPLTEQSLAEALRAASMKPRPPASGTPAVDRFVTALL
ncbi:glycosyltransferase [Labedella populi]|uniref:D-inositol 3-phosphate glycosyltransferase n=1 Tax=Labedella populi TaxID=2498850 RepID=A0A444QGG5_9MICO|nr:glycosyltransferase [Labedella populi]RWZ68634.1 glycosyltransferase [Labedella populi]